MDFKDKAVIVTGGGSGIGRACVEEFAKRNAKVALVDRDAESSGKVVNELQKNGAHIEYFQADISDRKQVEGMIAEIGSSFGRLDVLVNNAGIQRYGTVTTMSEEEWDEVMNVNLKGAFLMTKYAIPEMIKSGGGSIVITGSVQSAFAQRNSAHYVVSKHALLGLTRAIAVDYGKQNIRANCVMPGAIDTPMLRWSAALDPHPEKVLEACDKLHVRGKMGRPEEVARVILFLASEDASFVTGAGIPVDGGLTVPVGGMAFQESGTGAVKT